MRLDFSHKKLVPSISQPAQCWKLEIKKSMSILIGIICPDAIVLASDSHLTSPYNGTHSSVNKISMVRFWVDEVLVAQSGLWSATNRVVMHMRKNAVGKRISSEYDVLNVIENSIRETKSPLDKRQRQFLNDHGAGLVVGFYVGKVPHLYTVDVCSDSGGICAPVAEGYATVGVGSYLADYLLREYADPKSHSDLAIAASIFAIQKVKETTKFCGGETTIRRIVPVYNFVDLNKQDISKSILVPQDFVNLAEKRLSTFDKRTKKTRNNQVHSILKKTGAKLWREHIKQMQSTPQAEVEENERLRVELSKTTGKTIYSVKRVDNKGVNQSQDFQSDT